MQVLFYYKILGSDSGIAEDSSFLCLDTVVGWVVLDVSKNCRHIPEELIFRFCFPCGILLRHTTISCGMFMTSGGGNSSEFVVFHYSAQLNFWLLCRRFFFLWHESYFVEKEKLHCC
jgi:hypothetical protein